MRTIKFRAWSEGKMKPYEEINHHPIWWFADTPKKRIMQFIGLLDKRGHEIYEGDIFACRNSGTGELSTRGEVKYFDGYFDIEVGGKGKPWCIDSYVWNNGEVIGNIYENPDLLPVIQGTVSKEEL